MSEGKNKPSPWDSKKRAAGISIEVDKETFKSIVEQITNHRTARKMDEKDGEDMKLSDMYFFIDGVKDELNIKNDHYEGELTIAIKYISKDEKVLKTKKEHILKEIQDMCSQCTRKL